MRGSIALAAGIVAICANIVEAQPLSREGVPLYHGVDRARLILSFEDLSRFAGAGEVDKLDTSNIAKIQKTPDQIEAERLIADQATKYRSEEMLAAARDLTRLHAAQNTLAAIATGAVSWQEIQKAEFYRRSTQQSYEAQSLCTSTSARQYGLFLASQLDTGSLFVLCRTTFTPELFAAATLRTTEKCEPLRAQHYQLNHRRNREFRNCRAQHDLSTVVNNTKQYLLELRLGLGGPSQATVDKIMVPR
ncbi:MAG: hypothetical protein AAGG07_14705 [Planctomycetota bacterium]